MPGTWLIGLMAVIGIGGGFLGLFLAWESDQRAAAHARTRCWRYGICDYYIFGLLAWPARERLIQGALDWNATLARARATLRRQREELEKTIAAMKEEE